MGFHTYPIERADALDEVDRFRYCSREELVTAIGSPTGPVLDLGCGTGFFTLEVAPFVDTIVGVDLQQPMLERFRDKSPPSSVHLVIADAESIPVADGAASAAFSTMTYHEYASPAAHREVHRALAPDGRLVAIDWSRNGRGETGPSTDERFDIPMAADHLQDAGFHVVSTEARAETFKIVARPA